MSIGNGFFVRTLNSMFTNSVGLLIAHCDLGPNVIFQQVDWNQ